MALTIETYDKEARHMKDDIRCLQMSEYNLEKQLKDRDRRLLLRDTTRDTMQSQVAALELSCTTACSRMSELSTHQDRLGRNVVEAEKLNKQLMYKLAQHSSEVKGYKKKISDLEAALSDAQKTLEIRPHELLVTISEKDSAIEELRRGIAKREVAFAEMKLERDESKNTQQKTAIQLRESTMLVSRHVAALALKTQEWATLQGNLNGLTDTYHKLQTLYDTNEKQLEIEKSAHEEALQQWSTQESSLASRLKKLHDDYETIVGSYTKLEKINSEIVTSNVDLTGQVQKLKEEIMKPKADQEQQTDIASRETSSQTDAREYTCVAHTETDNRWFTNTVCTQTVTECYVHQVDTQTEPLLSADAQIQTDDNVFVSEWSQGKMNIASYASTAISSAVQVEQQSHISDANVSKGHPATASKLESRHASATSNVGGTHLVIQDNLASLTSSDVTLPLCTSANSVCLDHRDGARYSLSTELTETALHCKQVMSLLTPDVQVNPSRNPGPGQFPSGARAGYFVKPQIAKTIGPKLNKHSVENEVDDPYQLSCSQPCMPPSVTQAVSLDILESNSEPLPGEDEYVESSPYRRFTATLKSIASMFKPQAKDGIRGNQAAEEPATKKRKTEDNDVTCPYPYEDEKEKDPTEHTSGGVGNEPPSEPSDSGCVDIRRDITSDQNTGSGHATMINSDTAPANDATEATAGGDCHPTQVHGILLESEQFERKKKSVTFAEQLEHHSDSPQELPNLQLKATGIIQEEDSLFSEDEEDRFDLGSQMDHIAKILSQDRLRRKKHT